MSEQLPTEPDTELRDHVAACPLGWVDGQIVRSRHTTDQDVIEWIAILRALVGLDT